MKKSHFLLSLGFALGLFGTVSAQTTTPAQTPRRQPMSSEKSTSSEASKEQLKISNEELANEVTDANKVSKILGKDVHNAANEKVGELKDIVIDLKNGRIAYAVLSTGSGLFGGGKLIAVPLDALSMKPGEEHFLIDAPKDRLASAPGFSEDNWPKLNSLETGNSVGLSASTDESTRQKAAEERENEARREDQERSTGNVTKSPDREMPQPKPR